MAEFRKLETYDNEEAAVLAAIDADLMIKHSVEEPKPHRDPPEGWKIAKRKSDGRWIYRRLYENWRSDSYDARQGAVNAAWEVDLAENGEADEPRPREPQEITGGRLQRRAKHSTVRPLKRTVVLESPYRGKDEAGTLRNVDYARRALADCLSRGEAAFASHLLYTQIGALDDKDTGERERGIRAGYMVGNHLNTVVFYMDHGMSPGMISALEHYTRAGLSTEFRYLDDHDL